MIEEIAPNMYRTEIPLPTQSAEMAELLHRQRGRPVSDY